MRILLSLLFLVNIIYASVAVVSAFSGSANIYRDSKELKVYVGIEINENDNIKTNNNTKIQLIFKDNTRITIGKNSQFSIESYLYDESKPNASKAKFKFAKGLFRTISGRIGKLNKKQFKISVKSATIGIRGTKFDVLVTASFVKVGVYEGLVYFENLGESVDVKKDHFFVYEYLNNKKLFKKGRFKESYEFDEKDKDKAKSKDKNLKSSSTDNSKNPSDNDTKVIDDNMQNITNQNNDIKNKLVKEIVDSIADLDYGYWKDTMQDNKRVDTFVSGVKTAESVMDTAVQNGSSATYTGAISSIVTDLSGVKTSTAGTINLTIDFASVSSQLSGSIDINNGQYKANITDGTANSTSFSSTNLVDNQPYPTPSNAIPVTGGELNGNYYGSIGNSVGGTFTLNGEDNSKVEGVFGAEVQ